MTIVLVLVLACWFGLVSITASDTEFLCCDCETEIGTGTRIWDFDNPTNPVILALLIAGLVCLVGLIVILGFAIKKCKLFSSVRHTKCVVFELFCRWGGSRCCFWDCFMYCVQGCSNWGSGVKWPHKFTWESSKVNWPPYFWKEIFSGTHFSWFSAKSLTLLPPAVSGCQILRLNAPNSISAGAPPQTGLG